VETAIVSALVARFWLHSLTCLLIACLWMFAAWQLSADWSTFPQYGYGWSVPFLCWYLFWKKWRSRPVARSEAVSRGSVVLLLVLAFLLLPT